MSKRFARFSRHVLSCPGDGGVEPLYLFWAVKIKPFKTRKGRPKPPHNTLVTLTEFLCSCEVKAPQRSCFHGAGRETRTPTVLPPVDFESTASTDSAIPANGEYCNRKRRRLSSGTDEVGGPCPRARSVDEVRPRYGLVPRIENAGPSARPRPLRPSPPGGRPRRTH